MLKKIKRFILRTLFFLLLLSISAGLILTGLYFTKLSDEEYIMDTAIDQVLQKAKDITSINQDYILGDSFQVEGTIKMDLSSEEYNNKSTTDSQYLQKQKVLNNLSKMNISYMFQQDKTKQQVYTEWIEKLGEEELYVEKQYINNSTQYFFVKTVLNNYVNDGNNNYFETLNENTTTTDNISYLYDFIGDSIKKNITKDQLKAYDEETQLGNEKIKVGLISYEFNNTEYKRLLNAILNDLKKDKRASEILSVNFYHVEKLKVDPKKKYLDPKATYRINIYVSKPLFKLAKYELTYTKGDQKKSLVIEGNMNKGVLYYTENVDLKYKVDYQSSSRRMSMIVYDRNDKQIGIIKREKDKSNFSFSATLALDHYNYDISYNIKYKDEKKESYVREGTLTFKYSKDRVIQLQGNIESNTNISANPKILVDTDSSVLKSSLNESEQQQLETARDKIKEKLEK